MAANIKKVKDVLLRSNTVDGYNNSSTNQHGSYKTSTPKLFECYNNLSSNPSASFNKNVSGKYDTTFTKQFSKRRESYDKVSASLLRKSYSTESDNVSAFNLVQHGAKSDSDSCDLSAPVLPTPDISHLTGDELDVLKRVFKREEMFERDEAKRLMEMERRLDTYERAVRQQASGKGKLKYIDLSLCRLCHETKFADGICGRVCHDCRRRVCVRCGSSAAPHWNPRKQKNVRGKWRCNICQLKLEFVCQSGKWFPGNRSASMVNQIIRNKIQLQDLDTSDTDNQTSVDSSSCFDASEPCHDLGKLSKSIAMNGSGSKNLQNRNRRRSGSFLPRSSPSDNDSETDDSVERARTHAKQKRAQRRNSSRRKSLKQRQLLTDVQDQDSIYNSDITSGYVVNGGNISPCAHVHSMQRLNVSTDHNASVRRHSDESVHSGSVSVYFKPDDPQTELLQRNRKGGFIQSNPNNYYFTPLQAGHHRDSWSYGAQRPQSPPLISPSHRVSIPGYGTRSSRNTLTVDDRNSSSERRRHSHNIAKSGGHGFKSERKRFSVDQPLPGHKVKQTYLMPPESPGSRCRRWSSDSGSSRRSSGNNETAESTDWNEDVKGQEYLASLKTRDVLLYRDKNDQNCRCNGLGMRIVGGQCRYGTRLGAFVTYVDTDGPADSYGIQEGDQVLMWNGKSLVDTTFEETKRIVNQTSEIVQLVVVHHEENYGMVDVTETADDTEQEGNHSCAQPILLPPSVLALNKPKRRMLPKTPIEMKKDERLVSGKLQMSVAYSDSEECLSVTLVLADDLRHPGQTEESVINPIALVHLLPGRGFYPPYETIPQFNTSSPRWNETFNILEISPNEVNDKSIEITLWDQKQSTDMFLGEVLLDLVDANIKDEIVTYDLQDHDDNSSPLPRRRRKESGSDATTTSQISPMTTTIDTSSNWSTSPSRLSIQNLNTEGGRQMKEERNSWSSPLRNRHSLPRSGSFSSKIKQKLVVAVSRMSSTFASSERRLSLQEEKITPNLSHSADAMLGYIVPPIALSPRHSTDQCKRQMLELGTAARSHTCSETGASIYEDNSDLDDMSKRFGSSSPDGDDIASMLGPAQVPPKPASEQSVCGDIRLGLTVTQGKLEIDIICVTGLLRESENAPPDTYVKTYLVEGSKVIQKKKTSISKASYEPSFNRKIKYSACNIHGRHIKVKIWARQGAFDKKLCLGETVIKLDGIELGQHSHTLSWYKLFPQGATDFSSNESLSF